jgi:hypothetical protein
MALHRHGTRRGLAVLAAAGCVLALLALPELGIFSYSLTGSAASGGSLDYYVNPNFIGAAAGSPAQQIAAIQAAADEWLLSGQANFQFNYQGTSSQNTVAFDNTNVVFYSDTDGNGALAVCYWWTSGGQHDNFDIEFFDRDGTWDFDWSVNPVGNQFDIQSVATHELGHAVGLGHSNQAGAVMYPSIMAGSTANRTLHADDIAGCQAIYGAAPPPPLAVGYLVPASAWIGGGTPIQIHGTNLPVSGAVVTFDGVPATNPTWVDSSRIDCLVPPGSVAGAVDVTVSDGFQSDTLTGGFSYRTCRLQAPLAAGVYNDIQCRIPNDAGFWYQGLVSEGNSGIPLTPDPRVIPLSYDWVLYYSLLDGPGFDLPYFDQMNGFWDPAGNATFRFFLPDLPQVSGLGFYFAVITGDPAAPSSIRSISNAAFGIMP